MAEQREHGITWTDATWNPIRGCSRVSAGCRNCYAERTASRFSGPGQPYEGLVRIANGHPQWTGEVRVMEERMLDPLRWRRPRRIFVNSMSDLFHENVADETIDRIFAVMALAPQHAFQVLTKRPARMLAYLDDERRLAIADAAGDWDALDPQDEKLLARAIARHDDPRRDRNGYIHLDWPLKNVWLGVSVENQAAADERIPLLLQTPAAVRWISAEPLLGSIDLTHIDYRWQLRELHEKLSLWNGETAEQAKASAAEAVPDGDLSGGDGNPFLNVTTGEWFDGWDGGDDGKSLDWVVVGGESGPGARPMHPDWARSLRDQCVAAGVAFHFKQWGGWAPYNPQFHGPYENKRFMHYDGRVLGPFDPNPDGLDMRDWERITRVGKKAAGRELDGRTWDEYPGVLA
jgi:protein gp37